MPCAPLGAVGGVSVGQLERRIKDGKDWKDGKDVKDGTVQGGPGGGPSRS